MPASFATIEQDDHDSPSVVRSLVLASACKSIQLSAQREIDIVPLHWLERFFSDRPSFLLAPPLSSPCRLRLPQYLINWGPLPRIALQWMHARVCLGLACRPRCYTTCRNCVLGSRNVSEASPRRIPGRPWTTTTTTTIFGPLIRTPVLFCSPSLNTEIRSTCSHTCH